MGPRRRNRNVGRLHHKDSRATARLRRDPAGAVRNGSGRLGSADHHRLWRHRQHRPAYRAGSAQPRSPGYRRRADPSTLTIQHTGLAVAKGDVTDTAQVTKQIAQQDVIISAIGLGRDNSQGDGFLKRAAESLVTAIRAQGSKAPRLIVVGGANTLQTGSPQSPRPAGTQQQLALDYLRTIKDVSWSYFAPASEIRPGARTGKFRLGSDQPVKDTTSRSSISMEDYAVAMVDEAEKPAHVRQQFTIGY